MHPDTFRNWLRQRGRTFDKHPRERGAGPTSVTVRSGDRVAELPKASSHKDLDPEEVRRIVDALGLDWHELPGPRSRV